MSDHSSHKTSSSGSVKTPSRNKPAIRSNTPPNINLQTDELRHWISNEITSQLYELKDQLNKEIAHNMLTLKSQIVQEVTRNLAESKEYNSTSKVSLNDNESARSKSADNQLAITRQMNEQKKMMLAISQQVCEKMCDQVSESVYNRVVDEIDNKIMPQVNNMVEWVNYNMEDGGVVVDKFRRAVEKQSYNNNKMITDGKNHPGVISPYVRTMFADSSSED